MRYSPFKKFLALCLIALIALAAQPFSPVVAQTTETSAPFTPPVWSLPSASLFLDVDWYHTHIIEAADLWNGGLDGQSGMGTYWPKFDGFFRVNLDRQWRQERINSTSAVAQSRAIYMNVEAYRQAGREDGQRFLDAVRKGADFLLKNFVDPEYGGIYWEVKPSGSVQTPIKQGYGNVHPIMALAQAYSVTQDPRYLQAALDQLDIIKKYFFDPKYPGAILPGFNRDFSEIDGVNNVDVFTHFFEALLALYDVTDGARHDEIQQLIQQEATFLITRLYNDQDGYTDRGYVAYNYDEDWRPSQLPYTRETQWSGARQASTGHNIELAYLLSRAVERGFDPTWLDTAKKLLAFCQNYAFDSQYGGMIYDITDYDGTPLAGNPDNIYFIWWSQMESSRAFLHFDVVRQWDTGAAFKKIEDFIHRYLTDQEYGGLYPQLLINTKGLPVPDITDKGNIWKTNYHFNMFFTEALRLSQDYPERIAALNAAYQPPASS